jgi:hypothetical protein
MRNAAPVLAFPVAIEPTAESNKDGEGLWAAAQRAVKASGK